MRRQLMLVLAMSVWVPVASAGTISISDGVFNIGDWAHITSGSAGGNNGTATVNQFPAGGNPGEFRRHRNRSVSGGFNNKVTNSWNFFSDRPYAPSIEGAISSLNYSEESLAVQGGTMTGTVALRQNGNLYRHLPTFTTTSSTTIWGKHEFNDLDASDFVLYFFDSVANQWLFVQTAHPDFSDSGSSIEFGYFRGNNGGNFVQYDVFSGVDNWKVELTTSAIPEPSAIGMAGLLSVVFWRKRPING